MSIHLHSVRPLFPISHLNKVYDDDDNADQSVQLSVCLVHLSVSQSVTQSVSQSVSPSVSQTETNLYIFTVGKMVKRGYKLGLDQGRKK